MRGIEAMQPLAKRALSKGHALVPIDVRVASLIEHQHVLVKDAHAGGLIDMAETLSARVCEVCGNPGTLQEGPAFRTRCAAHTGQPLA